MVTRSPHRRVRSRAALVTFVVGVVILGACGGGSGMTELADDPADVTIAGPRPTAPPTVPVGSDVGGGANALIRSVDALANETDLCVIVTGEGISDIISAKPNVAGLASNPAGLAQLVVAVDKVFLHAVDIAPVDLQPAMATMQQTWRRVATIDNDAVDAQAQIDAIFVEPEVVAATQSILTWAALNCELPATTTTTAAG